MIQRVSMLLSTIKKSIEYRLSKGKKLPEDEVLQSLLHEAAIYVANRCDPAELIRPLGTDCTILKAIEGGKVIIEPEYPDFTKTERHLQIDETLSFAVINYLCFLISKEPMYKQLSDEDIAIYRCDSSRVMYGDEV